MSRYALPTCAAYLLGKSLYLAAVLALLCIFTCGCNHHQPIASAPAPVPKHEHHPPHGGTPVVLGNEEYHVELVLDAPAGKLQAYIFDGELENFVRIAMATFEVTAKLPGHETPLIFQATSNRATGETVGDTSLFEAHADWLKTTPLFDAVLKEITVRGSTYQNVAFNFPKGNDHDDDKK